MTDSPLAMLAYADWPIVSATSDRVTDDVLAEHTLTLAQHRKACLRGPDCWICPPADLEERSR